MEQNAKIYIAGHRGMVGSGIERKLRKEGYNNIITKQKQEQIQALELIHKYIKGLFPFYI